jgi:hypothetical protein
MEWRFILEKLLNRDKNGDMPEKNVQAALDMPQLLWRGEC